VAYDVVRGTFAMPQGTNWRANSSGVAKYVNQLAPTGGSVRLGLIAPASRVKVVAKSLGETPLDISSAPIGSIYVVETIVNGGEETRLCTRFEGCVRKVVAGGTGSKLLCKGRSFGDPSCAATVPLFTPTCVVTSGTFCDLGDGTVYDSATGLQWEQKTMAVGSGVNAADLNDVDNGYRWSGYCSAGGSKPCQPNLAAETTCKTQTDPAYWSIGCEQCTGAEGTCIVFEPAVTTVWDWLVQLNAANYAGHDDWRLPSESGCNSCLESMASGACTACSAHELETIRLSSSPCGTSPCIASIFGPTVADSYWSSSTLAPHPPFTPEFAWTLSFFGSNPGQDVGMAEKDDIASVRAVRRGS